MDPEREEELLLHMAAGTDPLMAFAALPRDDEPKPPRRRDIGCCAAVLAALCSLGSVWVMWHLFR